MRKILLCFACALITSFSYAIDSVPELCKAVVAAHPGDTLVLKNGTYRDVELLLSAKGNKEHPIVVRAETPGGVRISGASILRISGTGIELNGFHFTEGYAPKGAAWEYRNGNEVANDCRITNCAIDSYDPPSRDTEYSWILLYGRNNRFDHNSVTGKLNFGVTFAVILDEDRNIENHHRIEYNYFGHRPNLGSNGGETIRVGTSQSSLLSSRTVISNNLFDHCDGEVEVISIKSCDNIISQNVFLESAGVLALRHGHRNLVEDNLFIGNNLPNTGGIRVINEGHTIRNNSFYNLAGDRFFAALAVMNAVPNSLPNRYHQVKDVVISNNKWINCANLQLCVGRDNERTLPPENVQMSGNIIYNPAATSAYTAFDRLDGFHFAGNKVLVNTGKALPAGFTIDKNLSAQKWTPPTVNRTLYGALWYRWKETVYRKQSGKIISVTKGQNTIADAADRSAPGDIIELTEPGEYLLDRTIALKHYLVIRAKKGLTPRPVIKYNGTKGRQSMITINDGGLLELSGLAFDAEAFPGKPSAFAAIAPAAVMKGHYSAFVDACSFYNFTEASFSPFRAQKTTFADTLSFSNCLFRDMSGEAIYLSAEKDDAGRYSAEYVSLNNCSFYKVLGYAMDLYRGGSDESTTGPTAIIDHCTLEDVNNKERGAGFRLFGVQTVTVTNTLFSNTGRGGASIRFDENSWDKISVSHIDLYNSGRINSFFGKVVTGPVYQMKPAYKNAAGYDFTQANGSPVHAKAKDGKAIGIIN